MKKIITALTLALSLAPALASAYEIGGANVNTTAQVHTNAIHANTQSTVRVDASDSNSASVNRNASSSERQQQRVDNAVTRGTTEITARIASLNQILTRIQGMKNVSATVKGTISTEIQTQISLLTALQTKINGEASSTTHMGSTTLLSTDIASITAAYRIYALVIPQVEILAAADRASTLATSFMTISTKLQTRITAAQAAGKDVISLTAALSDLNAKVSDSKIQSQTAISAVANLTPDNGNATVAASNKTALENGRSAIKATIADFEAARKDARSIISVLQSFHLGGSVSGTTTASTTH